MRWRARFVIDASGRDTLLANKLRCKRKNPRHNTSALFGHFRGASRLEGKREGNISVMWFRHGWFWFIPLADGTTSVGVVCWPQYLKTRDKPLRDFFADTIALCPQLAERLRGATLVDEQVHATGNYSYTSDHACGDRYLLLGDAYTFIDPMFSSGVYLAMRNAFDGVDVVTTRLDRPQQAQAARRRYEALARKGPDEFSWFIMRVTNPTIRQLFMYPQNPLRVQEALLALLAGDLYGRSPIQPSLWVLKAIYYLISLRHLPRSFRGWRQRRRNLSLLRAAERDAAMETG